MSNEERTWACYKAKTEKCVEMCVHVWFCLSSDLDVSVMTHTTSLRSIKTSFKCFFVFLYTWLFYKMNLLWYWFCLFFCFDHKSSIPASVELFQAVTAQVITQLNTLYHTVVCKLLGGENFELCVCFFYMFIEFRFYWCLWNKCKSFIFCLCCSLWNRLNYV